MYGRNFKKNKVYIYNSVQTRAGDFFPSLSPQRRRRSACPPAHDVPHSFRDGRGARVYRVFDDGLHVGRRLWRVSHARPSGFAYVRRNSGGPDDIAVRYVVRYPPVRSSRKSADVSARRQQPPGPRPRAAPVCRFNGAGTVSDSNYAP